MKVESILTQKSV